MAEYTPNPSTLDQAPPTPGNLMFVEKIGSPAQAMEARVTPPIVNPEDVRGADDPEIYSGVQRDLQGGDRYIFSPDGQREFEIAHAMAVEAPRASAPIEAGLMERHQGLETAAAATPEAGVSERGLTLSVLYAAQTVVSFRDDAEVSGLMR